MISNHKNVSGTGIQVLSTAITGANKIFTIERLLICNTDSTDITVSLYLDDGSDQFYLLKVTTIPTAVTLDFLNGIPFQYQSSYAVKLVLGDAAYTADIIFNQY